MWNSWRNHWSNIAKAKPKRRRLWMWSKQVNTSSSLLLAVITMIGIQGNDCPIYWSIQTIFISNFLPHAFAYFLNVANEGEWLWLVMELSSREMALLVVPISIATSDWVKPASLRALNNSDRAAYSSSRASQACLNSGFANSFASSSLVCGIGLNSDLFLAIIFLNLS